MCSSFQWSSGTVQDIVHLHFQTKEMAEEFETGERREGGRGEREGEGREMTLDCFSWRRRTSAGMHMQEKDHHLVD